MKKGRSLWVTDSDLPDPSRHNYYAKVIALRAMTKPGSVRQVNILHDEDCAIYLGSYCDCDPDVRFAD